MRHGHKLKRLGSGSPDHRYAYLRNLVSALLHHEMLRTTVPRAKIAARMAEKIITLGKRGTVSSRSSAESFLKQPHKHNITQRERNQMRTPPPLGPLGYPGIDPHTELDVNEQPRSLLPKVFGTLAERYKDRPGGYTRIHKFGMRKGDSAPEAILTLVDGPRDLRFEMLARQVGKEAAAAQYLGDGEVIKGNLDDWLKEIPKATREEVKTIFQYRPVGDRQLFESKARDFADELAAEKLVFGDHAVEHENRAPIWDEEVGLIEQQRTKSRQRLPGERLAGMSTEVSGLRLAKGALVGDPWMPKWKKKRVGLESDAERLQKIEKGAKPRFISERRDRPQKVEPEMQEKVEKPKVLEDVMREAGEVRPASASGLMGWLGLSKRA